MKAPLPKTPIQQEAGVGKRADASTEQNSCTLIQSWILFNCQNLSDGKRSFRKQTEVMISLLFLYCHSIQNIKHNYKKKEKVEEHLVPM